MKTKKIKGNNIISIAVVGCLIVAVILTIGTFSLGRNAGNDTAEAVRNVSLLYLSELAGRREQVVSSVLNDYIRDLDVAAGMLTQEDLSSIESLQAYQLRMKQLYDLEKFAFIDTEGVIYTSRGTRLDIDQYGIDYEHLYEPQISIKNIRSNDKKVVIALPVDNLHLEDHILVVCFMEIDMDNLLRNVSIQSNNNTTFCNIYTVDGIALTDMVLGGLASEDNLLEALQHADYEEGYDFEDVVEDFSNRSSGEVSFTYNGIRETLYYVPVSGTDWMLTYLIRESIIGEQINSISESIILRSVIQSVLTALVLLGAFALIFLQQRQMSRATLDREVSETENRVRQQELEEQLAMQEELASKSEELEIALRAAEDANQAKSAFVSNMSHEIRTPITAILGMNEMIRRESNDENILSYADNINNAGISLLGIISDILDFSKIEAGRMELTEVEYSLPALIRDLYNLIFFRAETKGLNFRIDIDPNLPTGLIGDELRVKQVITNLLTNAVKYTERGEIVLDIRCDESGTDDESVGMQVSVSDTGIGISAEEMDKLFVPFDRLDILRTRSIEGAGLGLSITRQLLKMMDSELLVESVYDQGSRFYFHIRQKISDHTQMGDFDPTDQSGIDRNRERDRKYFTAPGKRILVVDDMPMNLQVLTGLLKRTLMTVDTAASGEECIRRFAETDYDMVFLDYRMPVLDGIDTVRKLRELYPAKYEATPIIALTASAVSGDREKLLQAGFTDYLAKPVIIADMEEMMTKYLGDLSRTSTEVSSDNSSDGQTAECDVSSDEPSDEIPQAICDISALDTGRGMEYCGDADDYLYALKTFADSVPGKAADLEKSLDGSRTEDYVLIVHSLKSMSKSIGAISLSERAKTLEMAGREGDITGLKDDTLSFIRDYRDLGEAIQHGLGEISL